MTSTVLFLPPAATRTIAVVLNGSAGALPRHDDAAGMLKARFTAAGLTPAFIPADAGTLPERIRQAVDMEPEAVVVAGGDGTIACAAQALAGTGIPLGIIPCGTMNLLARDLGIPTDSPWQAAKIIAANVTRDIDIAEVNGRVFVCASMIGLPAQLGRIREAGRTRDSPIALRTRLGLAFLRMLRRYLPRRFVVEIGGNQVAIHPTSITITVNQVDEPQGRRFGRSRLNDGELFVYVVKHLSLSRVAGLCAAWLRRTWRQHHAVTEFETSEILLLAGRRAVRVMNDGEQMLMMPPLRYRIRPNALRVFAPPAA